MRPCWTPLVPTTTKEKLSQANIFPKYVTYSNLIIYATTTYAKVQKHSAYQLFVKLEEPHFGPILSPLLARKPQIKVFPEKPFELILKLMLL